MPKKKNVRVTKYYHYGKGMELLRIDAINPDGVHWMIESRLDKIEEAIQELKKNLTLGFYAQLISNEESYYLEI